MKEKLTQELLAYNNSFSTEEIELGLSLFEEKEFKANTLISKAGEVCEYLFYAERSITRCFYMDGNGQEQTLWMKPEQKFITEYKSFVNKDASQFSLQFYEDTRVLMISRKNLVHLYEKSKSWGFVWKLLDRAGAYYLDRCLCKSFGK